MNKKTCRQWALQGRHSCIAQGGMRAKPDMKPWVNTKRKVIWAPSGAALSARTFASCRCGGRQSSATPTGLNKYTITNNPGLALWALKKYRPLGALLHPTPIHLFYLMRLPSLSKAKRQKISVGHKHNLLIVFDSLLASYKFSEAKLRIQF